MWIYKAEEKSLANFRVCLSIVLGKRHGDHLRWIHRRAIRLIDWLIWPKDDEKGSVHFLFLAEWFWNPSWINSASMEFWMTPIRTYKICWSSWKTFSCTAANQKVPIPLSFIYLYSILTFDFQPWQDQPGSRRKYLLTGPAWCRPALKYAAAVCRPSWEWVIVCRAWQWCVLCNSLTNQAINRQCDRSNALPQINQSINQSIDRSIRYYWTTTSVFFFREEFFCVWPWWNGACRNIWPSWSIRIRWMSCAKPTNRRHFY